MLIVPRISFMIQQKESVLKPVNLGTLKIKVNVVLATIVKYVIPPLNV